MPQRYSSDHSVGDHNMKKWGMDVHHPVFWITSTLILLFVIATVASPGPAKETFDGAKGWSIENFDWLFSVGGNIFVIFCLSLIVLPVGKIRLGGKDAKPEFSMMSWFAMLFAAGMGIGLMFWSVAEPVGYYTDWFGTPLNAPPNTTEGAEAALGATMFLLVVLKWVL